MSVHWNSNGGTRWPVDIPDTDGTTLEWELRFGHPDRNDLLSAASILGAYRELVDPHSINAREKFARARRAAKAAYAELEGGGE